MSAVNFLGRTLPEARLEIIKPKADGITKVTVITRLFRFSADRTNITLAICSGNLWD